MGEGLITDQVARNIIAQMKALDAMAEERERLKRETVDGCRLDKGLEVFSADDPFYSMIILDPNPNAQMARCTIRQRNDRRKKYVAKMHKSLLYESQFEAAWACLKRHDKMTKEMTCKLDEADKIKAERAEMRLEILDVMAMGINAKNPKAIGIKMDSKRFKKRKKKK